MATRVEIVKAVVGVNAYGTARHLTVPRPFAERAGQLVLPRPLAPLGSYLAGGFQAVNECISQPE